MTRDRDATTTRLLEAAAALMLAQGAAALGVNALAKAAACDKQLIYRYFGGLDGVLEALGQAVAQRLADALALPSPAEDWPGFTRSLAQALLAAYRADPMLGRLRAAELAGAPGGLAPFVAARGQALAAFVAANRPPVPPPDGVDVAGLHAVLIGAIEAAVLSAASSGALAGMPLASEPDWQRLAALIDRLIAGAYGVRDL